ncbi:helix-turn-helix domain-containing protein [Psychroserpens luteus]|nr:helix-turn-helix domain-containing protein [Psychroserpens luteus]
MNFENLNFNIFNIIIFTGIIHGFIFSSVVLINKKLNSKPNFYLSFTVLALAFSNLQYWFLDTGITQRYQYDNNSIIFIPFEFLILPFFYLFVKSYINKKLNKTELFALFSPFVLCVIYLIIRNTLNDNLKVIKIFNLIVEYLSICLSLTIIILVFRMLYRHEKSNKKQVNNTVLIKTKWLKRILIIGIILCVVWFISLNIFIDIISSGFYRFYPLWIGMSILIYWVGYTAILQKQLYNQRTEIRNKLKSNKISKPETNNGITTFTKLESVILTNKIFLEPSVSLTTLSKEFNLSEGYISTLINTNSDLNFNDFINSLRINEAKEMLSNIEYDNYTIIAIGLEAGFNSKSSFYSAFKKFTNKTPNEYKKYVRNL